MFRTIRSRFVWLAVIGMLTISFGPRTALTQPKKPRYATQADLDRLEKKVEEQRQLVTRLIKLQQQYLQSLLAVTGEPGSGPAPADSPSPIPEPAKPAPAVPHSKPAVVVKKPAPVKTVDPKAVGSIVGKVKGGGGEAVVYVEIAGGAARGTTAAMKQQGKQFVPRVLIVQKGTKVDFPNMDTVFHNVFSVTPDNSFDLGSYRQGDTKSVTMTKSGVVTVYCNMHPQMVGHVLVVPSSHYAKTGADGFYKISNVPAGKHRVVAWAPNAKPVVSEIEVNDAEATSAEFEVTRRGASPHTNKDGMPYGSYRD